VSVERADLTLSVALSCYNSARYLGETIDSILAQTRPPEQIVVGDDGSTDASLQIVHDAIERSKQLGLDIEWTILDSNRYGIGKNMDRIVAACRHDVIVVCDSDDISLPFRFDHVTKQLADHPDVYLIATDSEVIDGAGNPKAPSLIATRNVSETERAQLCSDQAFRMLNRRFAAEGAATAYRRQLVEQIPPRPEHIIQDMWFALMAAAMTRFLYDERQTIKYRVHASNTTGGVRQRSASEKWQMLFEHGAARNARLLARAEDVLEGVRALGDEVPSWVRQLAEESARHERTRAAYPHNRVRRLPHVIKEASSGAYARSARGNKDVLLDLLQPLG
jgi:hypothetical protein